MNTILSQKKCIPCEAGTPTLTPEEIARLQPEIDASWKVIDTKKLHRQFKFPKFMDGIAFINTIAAIAEKEGHHPDIEIHYTTVKIDIWTHAIGGLSENDFILAAKIEQLYSASDKT